jgi:hypothetical protein
MGKRRTIPAPWNTSPCRLVPQLPPPAPPRPRLPPPPSPQRRRCNRVPVPHSEKRRDGLRNCAVVPQRSRTQSINLHAKQLAAPQVPVPHSEKRRDGQRNCAVVPHASRTQSINLHAKQLAPPHNKNSNQHFSCVVKLCNCGAAGSRTICPNLSAKRPPHRRCLGTSTHCVNLNAKPLAAPQVPAPA